MLALRISEMNVVDIVWPTFENKLTEEFLCLKTKQPTISYVKKRRFCLAETEHILDFRTFESDNFWAKIIFLLIVNSNFSNH